MVSTRFFKKGFSTTCQFVMQTLLFLRAPSWNGSLCISPSKSIKARPKPSFFKRSSIFHKIFKGKEAVFTVFLCLFKANQKRKIARISQKHLEGLLTYFYLPTWALYLRSTVTEQPLQVMVCCILALSYDRCAILRDFPMTCL